MIAGVALGLAVSGTLFSLMTAAFIRLRLRRWLAAAYLRGYRDGRRDYLETR